MDPLSALSLAGTIVQLVDFGKKLFSDCEQLYNSSRGVLTVHEQLELVTADLQSVFSKLKNTSSMQRDEIGVSNKSNHVTDESIFLEICDEAAMIADELLAKLRGFKIKDGKHRSWETLKAVVKPIWSRDEIENLKKQLATFKDSLDLRLFLSIRYCIRQNLHPAHISNLTNVTFARHLVDTQAISTSARFDLLDAQTQRILLAILNSRDDMSREITATVMTKLLCRFQSLNQDEHPSARQQAREKIRVERSKTFNRGTIESIVGDITAEIEMLDVNQSEEIKLRNDIWKSILAGLKYDTMTTRYEDVVEAHPETFDWVFCDPVAEQLPWSDFKKRLREDGGVYWLSGKPGSGKSTLMKHIYDDSRTREYLAHWANTTSSSHTPFYFTTFFF
jgi:hypothetical protein